MLKLLNSVKILYIVLFFLSVGVLLLKSVLVPVSWSVFLMFSLNSFKVSGLALRFSIDTE